MADVAAMKLFKATFKDNGSLGIFCSKLTAVVAMKFSKVTFNGDAASCTWDGYG